MDKEVSMLVHVLGNSDAGVSMDRLTRAYQDTFTNVDVTEIQRVTSRLVDRKELSLFPLTGSVAPSPMFLALYSPGGTVRLDEAADLSSMVYVETYVPDFAAGFLIGKHGEYCSQIFATTGVRVLFSPFRHTLQKAVLNTSRVHPEGRLCAAKHALVMLRRRIYALYYSYKARLSDAGENHRLIDGPKRVVRRRHDTSVTVNSWSVWSCTPLSALLTELTLRT